MLQSNSCELEVTESLCIYDGLHFIQVIIGDLLSISARLVRKVLSRQNSYREAHVYVVF